VRQAGVGEYLSRRVDVLLMHQNSPRQNAERALDDAHVLVRHQMIDMGAIEQRADRRHQHDIIGPNQFPQLTALLFGHVSAVNGKHALAAPRGSSYCDFSIANVETGVAVIVPFETPEDASIEALVSLVAADMERVNTTILSRTGSEVTMIPEVANHLISSGGKRLRPMLTLAMAGLSGYTGDGHIKLAAAVEFMHTATLLHDDVVDESELRRGKLSARMLWGNEASVLVGDFLLGQAFRMMVEVGSLRALDILSAAAATIAEGEVMQLAAAKNTATTEDEYLAVIRGKTAELFAAACEVGPAIANRPKAEQTACRSVGMNLGIAFQLVDDVLDYGGKSAKLGKNVGDDFREGKITLPVVFAFRRGNDSERAFWVRALERGEIKDGDLDHAIGLMTKHRALEDTMSRAQHYGAMVIDALALFPPSPMRSALEQVVAFCLARSH
jgi:octaprenyl-diphosphate synthase